jgi:hypothetical protein
LLQQSHHRRIIQVSLFFLGLQYSERKLSNSQTFKITNQHREKIMEKKWGQKKKPVTSAMAPASISAN